MRDPIAEYYSGQDGSSLPFFIGKQHGTGWLRTLARIALPILKTAAGAAGNIAVRTAADVIDEKKTFKESLKDNALSEVGNMLKRPATSSINTSSKKKKKKKRHTIFSK